MAFRPFLKQVTYIDETNSVVVTIEHRDGDKVVTRTYERKLPITVQAFKTIVLTANQSINNITKPTIVTTLEELIDTEIT